MISLMPVVLANEDGSYSEPHKRSHASLVVLSDEMSPDEISTELGFAPDQWALQGEFESHPPGTERFRRSRPYPHNTWTLQSRLDESAEPEMHLADVIERIGDRAQRVADLAANPRVHSARLWLALHINNENPGISLSGVLIRDLAVLTTGIEIDIYVELDEEGATPKAGLR